ncbi:MAG TPA: 16S rRNA (cytosine(967)-C(5))-methyltransferase RsmB [Bacteroidota bacterium]|nr:16S rRNA (cytosine(967)-C(5))-methyltransferase RsmB [Bacteroidota bacterium]
MKKSSLIGHTVEAYDLIFRGKLPADSIIDAFFRSHKYLGSHDRRFIAETVYGMLRHKTRLEWLIDKAGKEGNGAPGVYPSLLVCFVYLVVVAGDEPLSLLEHYEADPEEKKFLPAILAEAKNRSAHLATAFEHDHDRARRLSVEYSFPLWMIEMWLAQYGETETAALCAALNLPAPLTVRVNTVKKDVAACRQSLADEKIKTEPARYSPFGLNLLRRMNVFGLEAFKAGYFEVQDEGSQLVSLLVDPKPTGKVVDACAGGGGKSLALAALMKNRGTLFALDTNAHRLDGLRKRIRRSGVDTIRVRPIEPDNLPDDLIGAADNVLVDAPCSGLGTIRRNPGIKWTVTPETIAELHLKQISILHQYARCVKPNGRLVYATCTTMKQENEDVVEEFLLHHPEFELLEPSTILSRYQLESLAPEKYFRLKPHVHGTDGFFAAVMKRKDLATSK